MNDSSQLDDNRDALLGHEAPEDAQASDTADPVFRERLLRIHDHRTESLNSSSSRLAAIGSMNAGLMEVELRVSAALCQALAAEPPTIESIEAVSGTMDLHVRLSKHILQVSNHELRLDKLSADVATPVVLPVRPK